MHKWGNLDTAEKLPVLFVFKNVFFLFLNDQICCCMASISTLFPLDEAVQSILIPIMYANIISWILQAVNLA